MIDKIKLFISLADKWPNSPYSLPNDYQDFDKDIIWHDDNSLHPTLDEIESHYQTIDYKYQRMANYPPIQQQLDVLYELGYDGWRATIAAVKERFPKP